MDSYNAKSCDALSKPYYHPIEAALRWCGLIEHEAEIVQKIGHGYIPTINEFPQWPCLRINTEKIFDAIANGEMRYGRLGREVEPGEQVTPTKRTVRHTVLKAWMAEHEPGQKPPFLFDEVERGIHPAITVESFQVLQAERDALRMRLEKAVEVYREIRQERDELKAKVDAQASTEKPLSTKERQTLLKLVAGMAVAGYRHDPQAKRGDTVPQIVSDLDGLGISVDEDTVRKHLKKAAETVLPATVKT